MHPAPAGGLPPRRGTGHPLKHTSFSLPPLRVWRESAQPRAQILALHGAMTYSVSFEQLGPFLSGTGCDVFAYDQRGFGPDDNRRHWQGIGDLIEDARSCAHFLRSVRPDLPLFVLGESMGGGVAALLAASDREGLLDGLILAAPAVITCPLRRELARAVSYGLTYLPAAAALPFDRLSAEALCDSAAVTLLADRNVRRDLTPDVGAGLLDLALQVGEKAGEINAPTLLLYGSEEAVLPRPCLARLAGRIAGPVTQDCIPGAPHMVLHYADQARVRACLTAWLEARTGPGPDRP